MSTLRLWLLIIGVAFILIYYLWARLKQRKENSRYQKWGGADDIPLGRPAPPAASRQEITPPVTSEIPVSVDDTADNDLTVHETQTLKSISELISHDEQEPTPLTDEVPAPTPETPEVGLRIDADTDVSDEQVIALHVVASDISGFSTNKLFAILEKEGLVFGNMNVFHMMLDGSGGNRDLFSEQEVIFSIANMHEPGVFDRDAPVSELITGIVMFMMVPCAVDAVDGYDIMLNTAYTLAKKLDGKVLDGRRSVLTEQAIQSQRDRLRVQELKASSQ